jgi:hypothetical protein
MNSVSDQQMVMEQEQVAFVMCARCTWSWEALVHPHEKVELIGSQTMRKYDLQNN